VAGTALGACLRPVGPDIWVAETPLRMLGVQAGRRMSVMRLASGDLLLHSPAHLTEELRSALDDLGTVRYVVAASNLHGHLFMAQYATAYPAVELFAPPGLERRRKDLRFAGSLGDSPEPGWADAVDQAAFRGHRLLNEILFFHRPSRSLIVGDVCWNVTGEMSPSGRLWAGLRHGVRPTPFFRLAIRDKEAVRTSVERILRWDFDRIVIGHGEIVETGGREAFSRAYDFLGVSAEVP
jgi:hypothetical protein